MKVASRAFKELEGSWRSSSAYLVDSTTRSPSGLSILYARLLYWWVVSRRVLKILK